MSYEAPISVSSHAFERALERFPGFPTAGIVPEVRAAFTAGRVSPKKPPGVRNVEDTQCLYAWTWDGRRVYVLTTNRFTGGTDFRVLTVIHADVPDRCPADHAVLRPGADALECPVCGTRYAGREHDELVALPPPSPPHEHEWGGWSPSWVGAFLGLNLRPGYYERRCCGSCRAVEARPRTAKIRAVEATIAARRGAA